MLAALIGPLFGAAAAVVLGWVFPETMAGLIEWLGWPLSVWQFGFCLGFVGAFFQSRQAPNIGD